MILEDNPYGELRFAGEDVPTLKSMDTDGRVIYCSSFSKILFIKIHLSLFVKNMLPENNRLGCAWDTSRLPRR